MIVAVKFFPVSISLVINLVILLTILHIQTSIQPYKTRLLGIVDSYLIINAAILYVGSLFNTSSSSPHFVAGDLIFSCLFLGIAYVVIAAIFGYHIDRRFPALREKLTKKMRKIWSLIRSDVRDVKGVAQTPSEEDNNPFPSTTFLTSLPNEQPIELRAMRLPRTIDMPTSDSSNYRDSILDTLG